MSASRYSARIRPDRSTLGVLVAIAALTPSTSHADVGPPAHLRISEKQAGRIVTQWRVPRVVPPRAVPVPDLPESCEPVGELEVEDRDRAWLFTGEWRCDGSLAGEPVGLRFPFVELALTTVVRVDLLSGDRFAHVLAPGEGTWRLPEGTTPPDRLRDTADAVLLGATHAFRSWIHLPFMLAAGLLGTVRRAVRTVTWLGLGQIVGIAVALPLPGPGTTAAEIAIGVTSVLLAREALRPEPERRRVASVALLGGAIHGLALGSMLADPSGGASTGLPMQLLALLGMDVGHLAGAVAIAGLSRLVSSQRVPAYIAGAAGVAVALGLAMQPETGRPGAGALTVDPPGGGTAGRGGPAPASRRVTPAASNVPIGSFLVVEPFEVRHEAMLRIGALAGTLGLQPGAVIGVSEQPALAERLGTFVLERAAVRVDGTGSEGLVRRADFMTIDAAGALPRTTAVPEPVGEAVVGVIVAYPTAGMADEVSLEWGPFPEAVPQIAAAVIDPESVETATLSAGQPLLSWKNALTDDPMPTVSAVEVEPLRIPVPLLSLPLLAAGVIVLLVGWRRRRIELPLAATRAMLAAALVVGPLTPTTLALPASTAGAPSKPQARRILAGLLPNVYRSMEFRDEGLIYDRLAVSVTGDTLTETYLQQRRTLELEERGGAQARVEAVEILEADDIEAREAGFAVRSVWTVSGMVTHFGHRHFRQNRYDARIEIVPVDGTWKIRSIAILEQDRLR